MAKPGVAPTIPSLPPRLRGLAPRVAAMLVETERLVAKLDFAGAERALTGALTLAPTHVETLRLHALVQHRRGRLADAARTYREALATHPDDALVLSQFGELAGDLGDADAAFAMLRRATELAPDDPSMWFRLGVQFDKRALHDEALAAGRRIVALDPRHRLGHLLVARNLHALGDIDGTAATYRTIIALGGDRAYQAWFSLVDLKTVRLDAKETTALEKVAADPKLGDAGRAAALFALGKVYEDAARQPEAFKALARANALTRKQYPWDAAAFSRLIDETARVFANPVASAPQPIGEEVIFVVGLPRSSTTLVEQIVSAHPSVEGASELPDLPAVLNEESRRRGVAWPLWVADATPADWERLGLDYLARTARWRAERPRFTDKLPSNWTLIGAAHAMLPGARFIDCRRDAMETCWSCFKQLFAPGLVRYAYDLRDLAAYHRDYERLCDFWRTRMPDRVRTQRYETLLDDPDNEIRALLDFCGLPFDEHCVRFYEGGRSVRTVSSGQVRQPLRRDTARTAKYGELLAPLRAALEAKP